MYEYRVIMNEVNSNDRIINTEYFYNYIYFFSIMNSLINFVFIFLLQKNVELN